MHAASTTGHQPTDSVGYGKAMDGTWLGNDVGWTGANSSLNGGFETQPGLIPNLPAGQIDGASGWWDKPDSGYRVTRNLTQSAGSYVATLGANLQTGARGSAFLRISLESERQIPGFRTEASARSDAGRRRTTLAPSVVSSNCLLRRLAQSSRSAHERGAGHGSCYISAPRSRAFLGATFDPRKEAEATVAGERGMAPCSPERGHS